MGHLLGEGTVLRERYKILGCVGQGGMGAVYRAADLRLEGRICAVKEIQPAADLPPEALEQSQKQFHREASVLARLDHPNLPKVSDYFTDGGREYLVMDFVAGRDLRQVLEAARREGRTLDERHVLRWAEQLCDALSYMHSQDPPVLHRDIKPANIKEAPGGLVKLVDFGLVKLMVADDTRTVTVLQGRGTLAYTPLEQYGGDSSHTDLRSDIYALGATLYHLLAGQPPADAKERFLRPDSLIPLRTLNPQVSPTVARAIHAALAMHPNDRPPTVEAFRQLLREASLSDALVSLVPPQTAWRHVLSENSGLIVVVAVLFLLASLLTLLL